MIKFLVNLLSPIFLNMGVSQVDIDNYAEQLSGYVYVILAALMIAIVVMVAAHWLVKKGTRHVVRWTAGISWMLILTVIANIISFGPMYNNLAPILNGRASVSASTVEKSKEVVTEVGEEGMVLLKNDNQMLPLQKDTNLNVFGWASTNPIYGGTGSGSSDNSDAVDVVTSLTDAGFKLNTDIIDMYVEYSDTRNLAGPGVSYTDWSLPEPPVENYTDELMSDAKAFSDKAMIMLSRSGGEGKDLPMNMKDVIDGKESEVNGFTNNSDEYDEYDEGETYLDLTKSEKAMIEKVCSEFEDVVLVINANNAMELGWVENYEQIQSVILAPGTGVSGMAALGEILNGEVNPSGKTVDTYVYDLTQTPTYNNYGDFTYNNVSDLEEALTEADPGFTGNLAFVNYVEGIYVGYKFYETAAQEGFINFEEQVQYPFGYGLSYTTFEQKMENFTDNGKSVSFDVVVTNTGDTAGKDVVEVYYTPPYTNGGIEKASVYLAEYGKTEILEPGESQTISFDLAKEDMASYDSTGIKTENGGYILEAGDYEISIRSDSHTILAQETFHVDSDIDYSVEGRESDNTAATNQFEDYSTGNLTYLSRANGFENYDIATAAPAEDMYAMTDENRAVVQPKTTAYYDSTQYDDPDAEMPVTGADNGVTVADLTGKDYDDPMWEDLLDQLTAEEMAEFVNLAGFQTIAIDSIGKVATQDSDGTSGLNDWYIQVYGTAYPTEVLIAQTWNKDLAYRVGEASGQEYADCRIFGTYSPAMNTHRSAFTGRNFEYYSEDGVLSGYMAANVVNGLQTKGVYAYIKHFVMNDQETNRVSLLQTFSDEQAIREIYMKPFEICVKNFEGKSLAVMSSFNFIGNRWTGSNPNLLNNVLRDEWGFQGMVLTDWDGSYGFQNTDDAVRNGNDAMLGFMSYDSNKLTNLESPSLVQALRQASKNILYTVANSGNYTISDPNAGKMSNMTKMFIGIDAGIGVLSLAILGFVYARYFKKKKRNKIEVVSETEE